MSTIETAEPQAERPLRATNTFYWSLRRELWEYRSFYIAPLIVAGLAILGFVIQLAALPHAMLVTASLPPSPQDTNLERPYAFAAAAILFCGVIVAVAYCVGTLSNERRDRSILFWKSLPVSDLTAVLAKVCLPLVVMPAAVFAVSLVTQIVMLSLGSLVLAAKGLDPAMIWTHWPLTQMTPVLLYMLTIFSLWYAPIYGWLLLVSGWARRLPILWAVLPFLGLCLVEKIALNSTHVMALLIYRMRGFLAEGFVPPAHGTHGIDMLALLAPGKFLASPGLWLGLVFAAACLAGAVWLRRYREPG